MRQLIPLQAAAFLSANDPGVDQGVDRLGRQARVGLVAFLHLPPSPLPCDQTLLAPLTDSPLREVRDLRQRGGNARGIEVGKSGIDIACLASHEILPDRTGGVVILPEPIADHLELHRLDIQTGLLDELSTAANLRLAKLADDGPCGTGVIGAGVSTVGPTIALIASS